MSSKSGLHWRSVAQEWKYFGSPLRPCDEDVQYMEKLLAEECADAEHADDGFKVRLCGVTPEIANMNWPGNAFVTAVEQSQEMINEVWPGDIKTKREAVQGDWLDGGTDQNHYDTVIGDGCFISVAYPDGYNALATTLAEILKKNGLLVMRFFVQSDEKESSDIVFSELLSGNIGSFHAFKWRLAMSLQPSSAQGVQLHEIYRAWQQAGIDQAALVAQTGWASEAIDTISLYENKKNYFTFITLSEIKKVFEHCFDTESIYFPRYELGERCPIIAFRSR